MRFVAAHGALGAGIHVPSLDEALQLRPHFIASDAGTTDAGPYCLGSGQSAFPAEAVRNDLAIMIDAARRVGVPAIVGSVGTAGTDGHVDATVDILADIAAERGHPIRVAAIYTEQQPDYLVRMFNEGRIAALDPAPSITPETFKRSEHIVAMIGVEPLQAALDHQPDIVVAGRCSDAALYAAMPIAAGFPPGLAWHAGKIVECGPMAMVQPGPGVLLASIGRDSATIRAIGPNARVTPLSIAAHSLYENADPFRFPESSGTFDLTESTYKAVDDAAVRIAGTTFHPAPHRSVKLEGAELAGFASLIIGGIRDPLILRQLDHWLHGVRDHIEQLVAAFIGDRISPDQYQLAIHEYGRNAVMGPLEPDPDAVPHEVGIVLEVLAPTQELASTIAQISRQPLLHHPIPEWTGGVTTFACLHNPAHIDRGPVYQFNLHHTLIPERIDDVYRLVTLEVEGERRERSHADPG
jgi:Acyclic terpene utilisation family protein AtuA